MLDQSPLTRAFASIAADTRAEADLRATQFGPVAALHALILAALARLFTSLEQIVWLWQSGQLPHHTPVTQPRRHAENLPPRPSARPDLGAKRATIPMSRLQHARPVALPMLRAPDPALSCATAPKQPSVHDIGRKHPPRTRAGPIKRRHFKCALYATCKRLSISLRYRNDINASKAADLDPQPPNNFSTHAGRSGPSPDRPAPIVVSA